MPIDTAVNFVDALAQHKLLEPAQLDEVRKLRARFTDPRALAKELIGRDLLTPYQVNYILANRAAELVLGSYVILERLGEGGMGQVLKARNRRLGRIVAIKVIRKERLANPQAVKRFQREIQAASQLAHPNVVTAYDADTIGDTQLFAMEYVEGVDLGKLIKDKGPLPVARACDYIRQAGLGLQHAYEKGLVHRDIKPSNLLVTKDHKGNHVIKVLDMGLARDIETQDTTLTKEGSIIGTPDYIAPEQARDAHKADIRADLYSLGCALFYMLTGQVPFQGGSLTEKLLKHYIEPPPPIQKVRPEVPPGVAAILHKLLEKKPADRYQTPIELVEALNEVVSADGKFTARAAKGGLVVPTGLKKKARGKTQAETGRKSGRMAVLAVAFVGLVLASVVGLNLLSGGAAPVAPTGATELAKSKNPPTTDAAPTAKATTPTTKTVTPPPTKRDPPPKGAQSPLENLRASEIRPDDRVPFLPAEAVAVMGEHRGRHFGGPVPGLAFSPDGNSLASAGPDGARVWNTADLKLRALLKVTGGYAAAYSPDGQLLAISDVGGAVHLFDPARLDAEPVTIKAEPGEKREQTPIYGLAFSPQSRLLATGNMSGVVQLWDLTNTPPQRGPTLRGHKGPVYGVAFSANGQLVGSASQDGTARVWSVGGEQRAVLTGHGRAVRGIAFSSGGILASGGEDATIRLWDQQTGKPYGNQAVINAGSMVFSLAASRQGHLLAGLFDGRVAIYQLTKQGARPISTLTDTSSVVAVAVDPQRQMIASGTYFGTVRIWDWGNEITERPPPRGHLASVLSLDFTPDGSSLVSGSLDGTVKIWELTGIEPVERDLRASLGGMSMVAVAPDGRRLAALGQLAQLRMWDLPGASVARELQAGGKGRYTFPGGVAFSPDSRLLAATGPAGEARHIHLWDTSGSQPRELEAIEGHGGQVSALAFAPDGETLASASSYDGTVRVWNVNSRQMLRKFELTKNQPMTSLAISSTGLLAYGTASEGVTRVYSLKGDKNHAIQAHEGITWAVAFTPAGDILATGGEDGRLAFWDPATGKKLRDWQLGGPVYSLRFTPDGRHLAVGNANGTIYVLKASP